MADDTYSTPASADTYAGILPGVPDDMSRSVMFVANPDDSTQGKIVVPSSWQSQLTTLLNRTESQVVVDSLTAVAANYRWQLQVGGITVNGTPVDTSSDSITLISGAVALLNNDPNLAQVDFKSSSGWVTVPRDQMIAMGVATGLFYQQCFSAERQVDGKIEAGTYVTSDQVTGASEWPSTTITS